MDSRVTVIVPTYNAEIKFLARCLSSVFAQSYEKIEILVCDDGSKDECSTAIDTLASRDCRCRVLHLPHLGVSSARNAGIEASQSEWIAFVDDDDEVSPYFVQEAVDLAQKENADFVAGNLERLWNGDKPHQWNTADINCPHTLMSDKVILDAYRKQYLSFLDVKKEGVPKVFSRGPVVKLYKRNLIGDIRFNPSIAQGEDALFNFQYLGRCSRAVQSQHVWYRYYQYLYSSAHSSDIELRKKGLDAISELTINPSFENARLAFECNFVIDSAEMVSKHCQGGVVQHIRATSAALQNLSQDRCFARLDLKEFRASTYRTLNYWLCSRENFCAAASAIYFKEIMNKYINGKRLL